MSIKRSRSLIDVREAFSPLLAEEMYRCEQEVVKIQVRAR
jgi:hypothetical protein